ncbi:iron-sulfur cluster biosynthesis family protein [Bacillus horti]|uniref:Uncharacterized protein YqkB n=1 Tax=Caldalkalibacillus horti TaxID=77523 RepID=A0ABT9W4W4_9BACI|nr:iron-sulfur cluster biosynthesis family protein [Bacillus horti]MDQ0168282.1 uncharacterized protein YqkB [Bacillus horti]
MHIEVKATALEQLRQYTIDGGKGIRVDAAMSGGCSSTVDIHLVVDDARKNDTLIQVEELTFFIDRFTQRYVDEELFLDYNSSGFTLYSSDEIFASGMSLYVDGVPNQSAFC